MHREEFNVKTALYELYKLAVKYYDDVSVNGVRSFVKLNKTGSGRNYTV